MIIPKWVKNEINIGNNSFVNEKKYQKDSIKIEKKFKYIKCSNALWHNKYLKKLFKSYLNIN